MKDAKDNWNAREVVDPHWEQTSSMLSEVESASDLTKGLEQDFVTTPSWAKIKID